MDTVGPRLFTSQHLIVCSKQMQPASLWEPETELTRIPCSPLTGGKTLWAWTEISAASQSKGKFWTVFSTSQGNVLRGKYQLLLYALHTPTNISILALLAKEFLNSVSAKEANLNTSVSCGWLCLCSRQENLALRRMVVWDGTLQGWIVLDGAPRYRK